MSNNEINTKVKTWYIENFPDDKVGETLNENTIFFDVAVTLSKGEDVYDCIGCGDSVVRERIFEELCVILECEYIAVYLLWLDGGETYGKRATDLKNKIKKLIKENK